MRYWAKFENKCRSLVRSWGFDVPYSSVTKFGRDFDIYGEHSILQHHVLCQIETSQPLVIVGECKAQQNIGADSVDQLLGRRMDIEQELGYKTAAYLFTDGNVSTQAKRAIKRHNLGLITKKQLDMLIVYMSLQSGTGRVFRKSLPNFQSFDELTNIVIAGVNRLDHDQAYTVNELITSIGDIMDRDPEKWMNDYIQHIVLLGLADQHDTSPYTYQFNEFSTQLSRIAMDNLEIYKDFIRYQLLQLNWHRDILCFTGFNDVDTKKAIKQKLEYYRPGYDKTSLGIAINMLQQADLLNHDLEPTDIGREYLWKKNSSVNI